MAAGFDRMNNKRNMGRKRCWTDLYIFAWCPNGLRLLFSGTKL